MRAQLKDKDAVQACYDARAIVALCAVAARSLDETPSSTAAKSGDIAIALELADELMEVAHRCLELTERLAQEQHT